MTAIERPAVVEVQRGQVMLSTTLTPAQLAAATKVDVYDPDRGSDPDNGYQRRASTTRMAQAAAFYGAGAEKRQGRGFGGPRRLTPHPLLARSPPRDDPP